MPDPDHTNRILTQGKALVRAIEALGTIELSGPFCRHRLEFCDRVVTNCFDELVGPVASP